MVTWGMKTYHMIANTIKMGWLTWNKDEMMLCGTPEAWANVNLNTHKQIQLAIGTY